MPYFADPLHVPRRRNDLLCIGESVVDMIATEYGQLTECGSFERFAGGSPANITANAKRLGLRSRLAAAVGGDGLGDFLLEKLAEADIDASLVSRSEEPTSLVVLTRSRESPTPIIYRGADSRIVLSAELRDALLDSSVLHFSCWPLSMEPARSCVASMIRIARDNGSLVCFDPNYHPAVWRDRSEAIAVIGAALAEVDIVKPSEDDANRLFGPDEARGHIRRYHDLGAKVVVMTRGKEGAVVSDGSELREYPSLAREVVDSTGAGDAFWSGLYAGIAGGRSLDAAIRIGMAVSALKLRNVGTVVPRTALSEIEGAFGLEGRIEHGVRQ